jgi:hypothetical protein
VAPEPEALRRQVDRWVYQWMGVVFGVFLAGWVAFAVYAPAHSDAPTPPRVKWAVFLLCAELVVGLALSPLVVGLIERRRGGRPELAWRVVTAVCVLAVCAGVALGFRTWADPPHNLTNCAPDYRGNGGQGIYGIACSHDLRNVPLGDRRLGEGLAGGFAGAMISLVGVRALRSRQLRASASAHRAAGEHPD